MKAILLFTILFFCYLLSCSTTKLMKHDQVNYFNLNKEIQDRKVQIELVNGEKLEGENIFVNPEVTNIGDSKINTIDIKNISYKDHGTGALKGLGYGSLVGVSLGFLVGLASYDEGDKGKMFAPSSATESGAMGMVVFGLPSALIGLVGGAISGDVKNYTFQQITESGTALTE